MGFIVTWTCTQQVTPIMAKVELWRRPALHDKYLHQSGRLDSVEQDRPGRISDIFKRAWILASMAVCLGRSF
jgi:hypothetical protein